MAITNFGELKTAVADWLGRADLTARTPDFISLTTARFNRTLRCREMLSAEVDLTSASSGLATLPADFLQVDYLRENTSGYAPVENLSSIGAYTIFPTGTQGSHVKAYSIVGASIQYYPAIAATMKLRYYQQIPAFTTDGSTNWLLTKHPDAYLYGAILQARAFVRDIDLASVKAAYDEAIFEINQDALNQEWAAANVNSVPAKGLV